ncbi:MAG: D-lyxose/D-mannose family sugar isomerase [Armatimonadetes bacterium]|nr:D-lyxose/D-mannose family sugar isomerase [Armatimonadota bacterium]
MMTKAEQKRRQAEAAARFAEAGIVITREEQASIEAADFGLDEFETTGLGVLVYVNTARCCAKELAMWPRQTCPEHRHPNRGSVLGKEETFRCRRGVVYLYVEGDRTRCPKAKPPAARKATYTVGHQIVLRPGEQYTLAPDTMHWFQAGPEGAVVSEFSTSSTDECDVFTDAEIQRLTQVV